MASSVPGTGKILNTYLANELMNKLIGVKLQLLLHSPLGALIFSWKMRDGQEQTVLNGKDK